MVREAKGKGTGRLRSKGFRGAAPKAPDRAADVVNMIAALTDEKGEATAPDLALRLGVSTASVVKTLALLGEKDLVFEEEGRIGLTGNGWKQA